MADQTPNYGLIKPLPEEFYDVAVQNANMDRIDQLLKQYADKLNIPAIQRVDLTIPAVGWSESGTSKYPCHLDIAVDGVTADVIPNLTVLLEGEAAAIACGLCPRVQTLDGVLRVFAAAVPAANIPASLTLQGSLPGESGGGSGSIGDLPVATPYWAGAVKPGNGLTVAEDGTLSVNVSSASEINQLLEEVFGS